MCEGSERHVDQVRPKLSDYQASQAGTEGIECVLQASARKYPDFLHLLFRFQTKKSER